MNLKVSDWQYKNFNFKIFKDRNEFIEKGLDAIAYNNENIVELNRSGKEQKLNYKSKVEKHYLDTMIDEREYENLSQLKKDLTLFDDFLSEIDMGGAFKKSKLKITDDKRGIFDFGIASKGLYNPVEYFSEELAIDSPDEFNNERYGFKLSGIVPADFVKDIMVLNTKQFWYTSFNTGKKYFLKKQKEGERAIQLGIPGAKLKYRTTIKKSYVMFEKKGGKAKMVEVYLPIHASVKIQNAFPLFLLAKFLQGYGISTRISCIRMYQESSSNRPFVAWGYPIKDYGEEMDFNFMALNGIDNRWWQSVRVVIRAINDMNSVINMQKGNKKPVLKTSFYRGAGDPAGGRKDYIEVFARFKNWYIDSIKKGELPPLRIDKKLMFLGGTFGISGRVKDNKEIIIDEFYRMLDNVDFQFNKPENVCARIYKRLVENKLEKEYEIGKNSGLPISDLQDKQKKLKPNLISKFKTYVQTLLIESYTYPINGTYEEDKESAEKMEKELDEKITGLNNFLISL